MKNRSKRCLAAIFAAAVMLLAGCGQHIETNGDISPEQAAPEQTQTVPEQTEPFQDSPASADNSPDSAAEPDTDVSETDVPDTDEDGDKPDRHPGMTGKATVHLLCAGDNLIHDNIYTEAWNKGGDHYDFSGMYDELRPYLDRSDIAILNQETLVNDAFTPSSYPTFSSPTEVGDAVTDIGFNVISMCNNHVLDKGSAGLISSLDYWDSKGVLHYGAYRGEDDSENIRTMEVNGVTFAFLGYMQHTNGIFLGEDDDGKVVYLSDTDTIKRQLARAREIADVVVVSCHFGTEVAHPINEQQRKLAPKLCEWGADIIIGTQAHCVSKCAYVKSKNGRKAFCYYGLGNLFHTMYDRHTAVGILGEMDVIYDFDTDTVKLRNIKAIPTISHFEADYFDSMWHNCKVYPLANYTDEQFARNFNDGVTRESVMECLSCISDKYLSIE